MKSPHRLVLLGSLLVLGAFAMHGCSGDDEKKNPVAPPGGGADVTINIIADMGSGAFGAQPTTITMGQTVSWRNTRAVQHTATGDGGEWNTGTINAGATSTPIAMNTQGSFPYHCGFHPNMTSTLVVNP